MPPESRGLSWVSASGAENVEEITLTLSQNPQEKPIPYTVRLHFVEVDPLSPGQRVFRVSLQGKPTAATVDVAAEAGRMAALVKEYRSVSIADKLVVKFEPLGPRGAICCGVEVHAEN